MSLDDQLRVIHAAIATLHAEAEYIRNELPRFAGSPDIVAMLEKVSEELVGTYFDLGSEFRDLVAKIDAGEGGEEFPNPDPRINLQLIGEWYAETMSRYHEIVKAMDKNEHDGLAGLALMLLMSCGTNLHNNGAAIQAATAAIVKELTEGAVK